jgi:hypothetical protein
MHGRIKTVVEEGAVAGLRAGGRDVLKEARDRVPVDDGELRKSGRVVTDDMDVIVKFTAPHAWLQHERTDYEHHDGGQAKYLENTALEYDLAEPVAREVRKRLGGG